MAILQKLTITVIDGATIFTWEDQVKGIEQVRTFTQVEGERLIRDVDNAILLIDQLRSHLSVEERESREKGIAQAAQVYFESLVDDASTIQDETPPENEDEIPPGDGTPTHGEEQPPDTPKSSGRGRGKGKQS